MPRFVVLIPVSVASPKAAPATATLTSSRRMTDVVDPRIDRLIVEREDVVRPEKDRHHIGEAAFVDVATVRGKVQPG